jgi:hypothetical protein
MFTEFDKAVKEILCGEHRDMCCLVPIIKKADRWLTTFGLDGTIQLLEMACECAARDIKPVPVPAQPTVGKPEDKPILPPPPAVVTKTCPDAIPAKGEVK